MTWWSPRCTVTILTFFFVTVYCLGLYDGDSLLCLFCLIRTSSPRQRDGSFVCFCFFCLFLSAYHFIISFPFDAFPAIRSCIGLGAGFLRVSGRPMFIFLPVQASK